MEGNNRVMKCYIATKLENHKRHNEIRDLIASLGIECTYDWTVHGSVQNTDLTTIRNVANNEYTGVKDSDFVIAILPGGRGTHVEIGIALGMYKPVFLLCETEETQHMMGVNETTCAFYHHDLCFSCHNEDELFIQICILKRGLS
jgi:nucleoside 2-deoxyribosyltransferase